MPVAVHSETIRLTPEQAEAAIEGGATRKTRPPAALPDTPSIDRRVHGEVGVTIGTGGYRSMYGVAEIPLGDTGGLIVGYDQARGRGRGYGNACRSLDDELCWRSPEDPLVGTR